MTELDKIIRAKAYIDKLANGVDPFSDMEQKKDSVLQNTRLSRCFFFVSEILERVIENGGVVSAAGEKVKFFITDEQKNNILITEESVGVNEIAKRINAVINSSSMQGATGVKINNWLAGQGYLRYETSGDKKIRITDVKGEEAGIHTVDVTAPDGRTYKKNIFGKVMQQNIIDKINIILGGSDVSDGQ